MYDVTIVGSGVIGCSIARELCKQNLKICVIEKASDIGEGTTKANSAIIHAGFDANPNTMKGKLNAKGNAMFDRLAAELDFPFKRIGSLVLCFEEKDLEVLKQLKEQGKINGVPALEIIDKEKIRIMEPNLSEDVVAALYAPSGGIVCPYEMTIALAENAYENGVEFKFSSEVKGIKKCYDKYIISTNQEEVETKLIINAAGVYADEINNMVSKNKIHIVPRRGEYCLFDKSAGNIIKRTIFQLPTKLGKGILVTPTVDGNLLLGPNAVDLKDKGDVTTSRQGLDEIISKGNLSMKELPMNQIITSFSGLRAHSTEGDFIVGEAEDTKNFINAAGIESPGLSSAPAIALMVEEMVINILKPEKNHKYNPIRKGIVKFREMNNEERKEIIAKDSSYGKIVCRCELVTEGEIIDAIRRPLGAKTLDGVKRRTRAGMGRCQAGFCSTKIVDILASELKVKPTEITKFGGESKLLVGKNKNIDNKELSLKLEE